MNAFGGQTKPVLIVEAIIIRACPHCGAKGADEEGKSVGKICPECGGERDPDENKGVIYNGGKWWLRRRAFLRWLNRLVPFGYDK